MPRLREHRWLEYAKRTFDSFDRAAPELLAVDTETTGLSWKDRPFGVSVAWRGKRRIETGWFELEHMEHDQSDYEVWQLCRDMLGQFRHQGGEMAFYNAKFDLRMLLNEGLIDNTLAPYTDVFPMVALLHPTGLDKEGKKNLKLAARHYLGVQTNQQNQLKLAAKELKVNLKRDGYWPLPREVVVPYALKDAAWTLELHDLLKPKVTAAGLDVAFDKEMKLVEILLKMERDGVKVKPKVLKDEVKVCDAAIANANEHIEELVGKKVGKAKKIVKGKTIPLEFNPGSPKQLIQVFKERGINLTSTGKDILQKLDDPLVEHILAARSDTRLRNTYLMAALEEMDEDEIIHPNFNSIGATNTGRSSSSAAKEI
jgi:DNA polymerase I-like protein with 3'-5' exonuclease and polymerase domains